MSLQDKCSKLLTCPIDWRDVIRRSVKDAESDPMAFAEPVVRQLEAYWVLLADWYAVDSEAELANYFNYHYWLGNEPIDPGQIDWSNCLLLPDSPTAADKADWGDEGMMAGHIHRIEQWIDKARASYCARMRFLANIVIEDCRGKHVLPGLSDEEIRKRAIKKRSFIYSRYLDGVPKVFWNALETWWYKIMNGGKSHIYVDCGFAIGASEHQDTSLICFDVSNSNVHAYPCSFAEAGEKPEMLFANHSQLFRSQDLRWM